MFNTIPFLIRFPFIYSNKNNKNNLECILCNSYIDAECSSNKHKCSCRLLNESNNHMMVKIYSKNKYVRA